MAEAMYRMIADDLRSKIESGDIAQASQLPTEIELMEQYDASRNTVRDAIKLLVTRGLVETRPGQGTFVVEKIEPYVTTLTGDPTPSSTEFGEGYVAEIQAKNRTATLSEVRVEIQRADSSVADALRIEEGTQTVSRHQQLFIDATPWSLQTTFYPMHLVESGALRLIQATDITEGAVTYLAKELNIKQVGYRDSIAVRAPDENEAAFFRLPADGRVQVFVVFRVGFDQTGSRFRLTITVCPADRNRFRVDVGAVPQSDSRRDEK
jgi:GntR family transcriptional regulator